MTTDRFQKLNKNLNFLFDVVMTNPNDRKIKEKMISLINIFVNIYF